MQTIVTRVLIIGGGATGTGLARDLALRGVDCVLAEKGDVNAGASGGNHGLLHSGGRYVSTDPEVAAECRAEAQILKQVASHCIEETGGVFVGVPGDDEAYMADFPSLCQKAGISCWELSPAEVRDMEPKAVDPCVVAYLVEDATIDPFRLSLENLAHAQSLSCQAFLGTRVAALERDGKRIVRAVLEKPSTGEQWAVEPEWVVNAAGAWSREVAALAGATVDILYSKGSLVITHERLTHRVINRLRPPGDGDILVPGGTVSLLGTTSVRIKDLADVRPTVAETDRIVEEAAQLVPSLESVRYIRAYAGVRPLITGTAGSESRGLLLIDHAGQGVENLTTITGGKLTTFRLMAEKAADLVCSRLGVDEPCRTRTEPLPLTSAGRWTEPGLAPRLWLRGHDPDDTLLCECEMVPASTVDQIVDALAGQGAAGDLKAVGLRSRVGKGLCQGALCGVRMLAHLYERGTYHGAEGLAALRRFVRARWRGMRPVLWGVSLSQEELQDALHCGFFCLELGQDDQPPPAGRNRKPPHA
ncbi:MAG: anaerobic glycerol-3-phosphate dehydrogenase subunit A [Deltaproteobacteria bacterium]|nr:anaerobic glycerol-3-phosphate dehydrogenase subunit A [Deltaproteobacteria bacterium]